jgi:hypothetical protein
LGVEDDDDDDNNNNNKFADNNNFFLILLFIATVKTQGTLVCTRLVTHAMLVTGSNFPNVKKRMFKYANILKPTRKI